MARKPPRVRDPELAEALRSALERGAFAPAEASRVIRALAGCSQEDFAAQAGLNKKVIKALESGAGNLRHDSLQRIAAAAGLRVAFVGTAGALKLLDPRARAADELRDREQEAQAIASGRTSESKSNERNALRVDVSFKLPRLA